MSLDNLKKDGAGSGEANTASNVGAGGVGPFKQKTGVNLEFKNINAGSNKITITNDAGNDEIDIDVDESNISHDNITGVSADDHHPKLHAADHSDGGVDEIEVEDLATGETDTALVLKPDGAGGLVFGADVGGGGGGGFTEYDERLTELGTTSASLVDYLTLNFNTSGSNEVFDVFMNFIFRKNTTSNDIIVEGHLDDTLINVGFKMQYEMKDSNNDQRHTGSFMGRITVPSAGAHTVKIKLARESSGTATLFYGAVGLTAQ